MFHLTIPLTITLVLIISVTITLLYNSSDWQSRLSLDSRVHQVRRLKGNFDCGSHYFNEFVSVLIKSKSKLVVNNWSVKRICKYIVTVLVIFCKYWSSFRVPKCEMIIMTSMVLGTFIQDNNKGKMYHPFIHTLLNRRIG